MARKRKKSLVTVLIICFLAVVALSEPYFNKSRETVETLDTDNIRLKVHFIDVGQGDSTLFEFSDGRTLLIDAGENEMGDVVCEYLQKQNIEKIDYLVGTHPHSDHIGGLDNVIESFNVGVLYLPDKPHDTKTFKEVIEAAEERNVEARIAKKGVKVIDEEDLTIKFLSPVSESYEELNNYSTVMSVEFDEVSFLVTGDAEYVVEKEIMGDLFPHDVLKVSHHGSNTSSTANFLKKVSPKYAVVSVGEGNMYGHPHNQVLNRLERFGAEIYRTDINGSITLISDGKNISFETER